MIKIIVDSEELKQDILAQSEYIHYFCEIIKPGINLKTKYIGLDSDKAGSLMHLYMCPDMIIVEKTEEK